MEDWRELDGSSGFWDCDSLADWLEENADPRLAVADTITVSMIAARLREIAAREASDAIDSMGEDA